MFNKKRLLAKTLEEDYKSGKSINFSLRAIKDTESGVTLKNFLDYYVPIPDGYSDYALSNNINGVSRFDGITIDLVNYKYIRRVSQLFLDFGFDFDYEYKLSYLGYEPYEYYKGYLDMLEEKGYRLELQLNYGPSKIYDRIKEKVIILDADLEILVKIIPLGVEIETESDLTSNRVTITNKETSEN